jgi:hypothetical protein
MVLSSYGKSKFAYEWPKFKFSIFIVNLKVWVILLSILSFLNRVKSVIAHV